MAYDTHGRKLCLVLVLSGAEMAQIHVLLRVMLGKIDDVGCLVQMHRTQHTGVAISYIKPTRIADIPVCKLLDQI
jgi:hypothetical protein